MGGGLPSESPVISESLNPGRARFAASPPIGERSPLGAGDEGKRDGCDIRAPLNASVIPDMSGVPPGLTEGRDVPPRVGSNEFPPGEFMTCDLAAICSTFRTYHSYNVNITLTAAILAAKDGGILVVVPPGVRIGPRTPPSDANGLVGSCCGVGCGGCCGRTASKCGSSKSGEGGSFDMFEGIIG